MNDEKRNASRSLSVRFELPSWELLVLVLFAVTVLGLALRSPMKSFPNLASDSSLRQLNRDPYDLQSDRSMNDSRNRVETGL
jgi:hypothetical protein